MVKIREKTKEIIKKLPEQKPHLDFIAALLTIPVLITVLLLNFGNLGNKNNSPTPTPTPSPIAQKDAKVPASKITSVETAVSPMPSPQIACKPEIGPISIAFPEENQTVTNNPLCIDISYQSDGYCAVVWAYKINNSQLSDYANNTACLYNLPAGQNVFTLYVKSLVSNTTKTLERKFIYSSQLQPISSPTPNATESAQ